MLLAWQLSGHVECNKMLQRDQSIMLQNTPNLYLSALAPNLYFPGPAPNLQLPALAPNLYLPALVYNFITSLGPGFASTNLDSSICICIQALVFATVCIPGLWPEFEFTLLLVVVAVAVVIVVVLISLYKQYQYLYADFSKPGKIS